jgi:hypothetical protein
MATNNSANQDYQNNADGAQIKGGVIKRMLKWLGSDITLTGSGSATVTLPATTDTLVGRATTDTLTNKTIGDDLTVNGNITSNGENIVTDTHFAAGTFFVTGTGNTTITGLPFAPKVIRFIATNHSQQEASLGSATTGTMSVGVATPNGGYCHNIYVRNTVGGGSMVLIDGRPVSVRTVSTGPAQSVAGEGSVTAWNSDGFTFNCSIWSTAIAVTWDAQG